MAKIAITTFLGKFKIFIFLFVCLFVYFICLVLVLMGTFGFAQENNLRSLEEIIGDQLRQIPLTRETRSR